GMASALPEKAAEKATARATSQAGQSGAGISQKQQETVNYEVSKVIRRVVEPAGGIRKLSAAVLVDGTYQVSRGKAGEEKKYVPRAEEELKKYEAVVKKAMGFNAERGDQVEVVNVPFDVEGLQAEGEAPPPGGGSALVSTGLRYGTALLAVVLFFLFVARPVLQLLSAPVPLPVAGLPRTVQEMEEELQAGGTPQALAGGRQRAIDLARSDPSRTAQVIKSWLKEKA
ncbi:MAG: hypothetical protein HYY85_14630, partial [Deltaproteobacteria bacterium]|nr:hypothetical protein [Deltaproteobacteria bacterium]